MTITELIEMLQEEKSLSSPNAEVVVKIPIMTAEDGILPSSLRVVEVENNGLEIQIFTEQ